MAQPKYDNSLLLSSRDYDNALRQNKINQGIPIFGSGYAGNIVGGIGENLLGGFSDLAKFANLDRVSNTLEEGANYFTERLKPAKEADFSLDYITSPEGLARGSGRAGGSLLSIIAPAALTEGGSLLATGASLTAKGASLLSKIPGVSSRAAKFASGGLLTVPPEAAMETGSFKKNAVLNGMSPSEAADKSWGVFGRNLGELAISNALQFGLLPKLAGKGINFGRRMGTAGAELSIQGIEEAYQQGIQNEMLGRPYSYNPYEIITNPELGEQRQAALEGFMTMLPIIGGGAVGGHLIDKATGKNEDAKPSNERDSAPNIDEFMQAIGGQESNGNYNAYNGMYGAAGKFQILPENWAQWAKDAGLSPDAEMTPENQEIVAKNKMLEYYKKFGDWYKVAEAWYGGESAVNWSPEAKARTQEGGYPSLKEYADSVMARFDDILLARDDATETLPADFGEGKYWIRQGDNVSYEGAQAQTMPALYAISKWFYEHTGKPLVVSAVTNGQHAEGEHSHGNGWKFDVHDGGSGAEGALFTDDFQRGDLLDEFVKYGQSLGLGMNVESLGTGNVHLDVSAAGDQWEGEFAGHNFGGFKGNKATPAKSKGAAPNVSATEQPLNNNEGDSVIDGIIQNLLTSAPETQPTFNLQAKTELDKEIFKMFVDDRKNKLEGEDAAAFINFLQDNNMLNAKGNFVSSDGNRELLRKEFGEEIQAFGDNLIAERYNRFMESQKSAAEKIQAAFTKLVQREVDEGNPDAMKHQQILQNSDIDAMTQLLKDANIDFDATPAETQTQTESQTPTQTESDEILNPADGWQNFSSDNQAKLIQNLKSALVAEGALDDNLGAALDNGDTQAISDALNIFRQINRDKPIQQILNSDAENLSDDAQKFRENYLKLQENITNLEQQRAESEAQMQLTYNNNLNASRYITEKNKLAEINKQLEKSRAELQNLQAPKNFKRVSESEQLENDIRSYNRTLSALNQQMQDIGEPKDGKTARHYNKLVREHNAALDNLWKAQARYDELNDAGKTWRESESLNANSPQNLLDLVQLGIEQTQRKLDAIQRSMRKAGENPKATKEAMRLGSQLSALKSVLTTQVNPTINVVQAIEGNADAQNTFNTLREQLIDTAQQINAAESQGDTATAESLKAQLPQLQEQTAKAWAYFQTLNEETAKVILQTAPQVLSKVYGQRRNAVNPVADISAGNVNADDMSKIQQQVSDILIGDKTINYYENATQNVGNAYGNQSEVTPYQNNELPIDKARRELNELEIQARKTESEYNAARERGESVTQLGQEYEELRNKINAKQAEIKQIESPVTYGSNEDDEQQSIGNAYGNNKQTSPQKESALSKATRELNELKKAFTLTTNAKNDADNRGEIDEADKLSQKLNDLKNKIDAKNDEINRLKKDIPIHYDENAEQFGKTSPNPQSQIQNEEDTVSVNLNNSPQEPNERLYYDENADQFVGNAYGHKQPKPKQTSPQKESALGKAQKKLEQLKQQLAETFNEKNSADEREDYNGSEKARQKLKGINQKIIDTENEIKKLESQSQTADNAQSPKAESIKIKSTFTQDILPDENNVVKGDKTKIVADNGKEYEVQYKVVEADDLIASHILSPLDSQVDRNENYPAELQPRDRDRISMQTELLSMANALRPADLMDSRNLNQGAPIVRSDNVVLNGNGRTAAIKFAYENAKADHYKQVLVNNSEKFGLDRNAVAQMKNPVLVREITDNLSAQDLQAITESQTGGVKFGASEQAKNDAGKIKIRTLELYVDNDNGDITTADNREFLISVLQDILNKNEINAYTTANGGINVDGQRRAKRALFALAYDDDTLIDKIAESTDDNIKKITNALESAAPRMAQIQAKMKEGILHSYDLSDIASAAAKLSDIRKDKKLTVQDYLGQQVLAGFGEESEIKKALVKFFDEHSDSAIYSSDFLKGLADGIERQGNPNQIELFDGSKPAEAVPLMNLIDNAKEIAADKLRERSERAKPKQINLFEKPEEKPAEKTPAERIGEALKNATPAPVQNEDEQVPTLDLQQPPVVKNEKPKENLNKEDKIDVTSPEAWRTIEETAADVKGLRRRKKETATDDDIMDISHVAPNIDISEEDRLWAELDKELKKLSANPIFNPKIYTIGLKLGMLYIKKGMSKFSDWAKELTNKGGANIKPWLSSIWETIRSYPPKTNFDEEQVSTFSEYIGSLIANKQAKTYEDVLARFKETFEKEDVDKFAPVIESAYKGIKKFFDENTNNQQDAENKKATIIVTGDEFGEYNDIKELRKKAIDYYSNSLQGTSVENKTLGKIDIDHTAIVNFSGSGKRELKNSSAKIHKLLLVKHLPQLISEATDITGKDSTKERHSGDYFYYLYTNALIEGKIIPVDITVVKRNNGDMQYFNHTLPSEERKKNSSVHLAQATKESDGIPIIDESFSENAPVSTEPESSIEALGTPSIHASSNINITQSAVEGKTKPQENAPSESQAQNVYTELQRKAQRGENLTTEEKTILVSNPENLVVDEKLREALYKKLPNVKHCIDIAFRAVKQFGTTDAKKTLTQLLVSDNTDNAVYAYATQELIRLWGFERALKQTRKVNPSKIRDKNKETEQLLKQYRIKEISAKELYGRTLKALYNLNEKSHRKPTSDYALNLENFKLYGKKSETRTTGDSKIIAKMSSDYKGVIVTQTANGYKLTYQIPLNEIDKVTDDNDAWKNLVDKYLSNAYKKLAAENNIPAEQIQESIEGVLERFANYHEVVVSNMHGHFREEVPSDENATPAENQKEEKAAPTEDKKPKNDDSPKPLLLQDGRKPYEVYKQTLDKKGQEFLEEPLGVFEIQRHNLVEDAVRDKKPRDSLKTEAERKYYDWLKAQLNENLPEGYTIEERRSKGDNGRDEYTAVVKGDFKTDAGKKLLNNLKELAEKLGGELKQSSDKVASFYFGEKTKPLKQFQSAAKVLFNQKKSAMKESVKPKNDEGANAYIDQKFKSKNEVTDEGKAETQGKNVTAENQGELNSYAEQNNDVDRGQRPRLLERSEREKDAESGLGLGRTQLSRGLDDNNGQGNSQNQGEQSQAEKVDRAETLDVFTKEEDNISDGIKALFKAPDYTYVRCEYPSGETKIFRILYKDKRREILVQQDNTHGNWIRASSPATMQDFQRLMGDAVKITANISMRKSEISAIQEKEKFINEKLAQDTIGEIAKIIKESGAEIKNDGKIGEKYMTLTPYINVLDEIINRINNTNVHNEESQEEPVTAENQQEEKLSIANDEIEKLAREALKSARLEGKNSNAKNFKTELYARNNKIVLLKKDDESDMLSEDMRQSINNLRKFFGAKANLELGRVHSSYKFQTEKDAQIFKTALDIYLGNKGSEVNESRKLGPSGSADDGHKRVQSDVRTGADESARQERRNTPPERNSGQQRQDEVATSKNDTGTNAEDQRPVSVQGTGTSGARVSTGNGVRGNTGAVQSNDRAERGSSRISSNAESVEFAGHNYHITNDSDIGTGGLKTKFKQNVDAIKLLKQLEREGRKATPSEQEILSKFNGWGTLASAFANTEEWQKQAELLKEILTEDEYKSALSVTNNAFYTSPKIAGTMWQMLDRLGFKGGRVLDPATGSGIFFGTMPPEIMARSELTGVEYDSLSGRIAQQLYQNAVIDIMPYQKRAMPNNYYDLAITNVPFEETRIYSDKQYSKQGYMLHNYYFAKTIDKVRPGGLVVFITSQGTMQSQDEQAKQLRAELIGKADLIAAFKLPSQTFEKNAGTQVTTDILILQKHSAPTAHSPHMQVWFENETIGVKSKGNYYSVDVNEYFKYNVQNMIGEPTVDFRGNLALDGKELNVAEELSKLIESLPENIYTPLQNNTQGTLKNTFVAMADTGQREGSYDVKDGKAVQSLGGNLVEVPAANKELIKDFVAVKKSLDNILKAQLSPETTNEKLSQLRETLNKNYDNFVSKHGYLNAPKNLKILGVDLNFGKVAAIENYKEESVKGNKNKTVSASKADIFYKRTASPLQAVNSTDNAFDAMKLSLSRRGVIDMDYMSKLTGKNDDTLTKELGDLVYKNPKTNLLELAEEYLSGNVREKLHFARETAKHNPVFKRNVEALEKVMPVDLTTKQVFPHMGANWIDEKYYYDFVKHLVGESDRIEITRDPFTGKWKVSGWISYDKNVQWRVMHRADERVSFIKLLEGALNHHYPTITSDKQLLKEPMAEARDKIDKILYEFDKWIFADETRRADLVKTYNEKFNSEVERTYDGSHLELPGLNDEVRNKLYPHQKDAIWRLLQGGNVLLAHCVGAGKSWEMIVGAMEMKRIGMISKPLFTVPNNTVQQFARDFRIAYPNANLLILTSEDLKELRPANSKTKETETERNLRLAKRRKILSQIATNDWDGIIISHNLFERLPMSLEGMKQYSRDGEKIAKAEIIQSTADSKTDVKESQKIINAANERIERDFNLDIKEIIMPFEELGIDQIFVDESDMFKNLGFETSQFNPSDRNPENRVVGVSTADARRSNDLYTKARWLSAHRNGGGLCFASGTPVSNTLNEIYTILRYLNPEYLSENGWSSFDSWANHFGKPKPTIEANAAGEFVQKRRLNLNNLPALINGFRKTADIKMIEDLPHLMENRPKLKNGQRTVITVEPTAAFNEIKKQLLERNEALHQARSKAERDALNDNYLKIVGDFRKSSLDIRLIDPSYSEEEAGGKINAVCDTIFAKFTATTDIKGTQVVFLDLSVPKAVKQKTNGEDMSAEEAALNEETSADEVTVYDRIKKGLIQRGIPANQIAFVHEAKKGQLQQLFDKVNSGEIRVIIGSTMKMGAGTNFQTHLVALHHVDAAWRPRDIEQREGRILRNGNLNKEVEIFTYVTKGSYDAINWDLISKKQAMIDSLMRGDPTVTEIEDISDIAADYKSIAATGDDNPLQKEMRELEENILRLNSSQKLFLKNQKNAQTKAAQLEQNEIPALERRIKNLQSDIEGIENLVGDNFKMKLGDTVYTKFGDAKVAFEKTIRDFNNLSPTKIGEIGGFNIKARAEFTQSINGGVLETIGKHVYLTLEKNGSYGVDNSLESIRNFISGNKGTSIVKLLEKEKNILTKLNAELNGYTEQIRQTFDKQEELDTAIKRLAEVQEKLRDRKSDETFEEPKNVVAKENAKTKKIYPDEIKGNRVREIIYDSFAQDKTIALIVSKAIQENLKPNDEKKSAAVIQDAIKDSLLYSLNVSKEYAEKKSASLFEKIKDEIGDIQTKPSDKNTANQTDSKETFEITHDDTESTLEDIQKETADLDTEKAAPSENVSTAEQNSFEIGTFTHTKTGEKIPSVKLKEKIERDEYQRLNTLAKQNGGSYNKFAKQFLFKTAEGRDTFVVKALDNARYYGLKKIDTEINNGTSQEQQTVSNKLENKNTPLQNLQTYEDATITNAEKSSDAQNKNFLMPIKSRYDWQNTNIHYRDSYTDVDSEINTPDGKIKVKFRFSESGGVAHVNMRGIKASDTSFSSTRDSAAKRRGGSRAGELFGYSPYEPVYYFDKVENAVEYIETMLDEYYSETAVNENPREIDFEKGAHKVIDGRGLPQIIIAYSQTGDGSTATDNLVDSKNLTDQHKLLQQLGKSIGANVVFFSNYNRDFHGAYKNDTIYLNVNSARSLTTTFAHELFHFLKANNPKLFSEMAKAAGITETQLANYLTETKRTDVTENADVTEEMIADAMQQILNRVAKKNPNLVQRFLAWLKDTFQKFKDLFQNPKGKLTRGQYANLADTFGKMAAKLTDADGNKLFRYNTRTHNLELANGESLETLLEDTEIENESSDEQGFFNLNGLSLADAKFSRNNEDDITENISEDEPSLNQAQINELFNGVNVSNEFLKLQTTTPINVSNELSQSTSRRTLIQAAKNAFSERYPNGVTVNTQIGEVKITRSSINDSLRHLLSRAKADSVLSLPTGIRNAAYIGKLEDFDGNPIINHYFVYPINYEGQKHLVLCRVREIGSAKNFYVHAIVSYDEINERSSTLRPSVVNNEQTQTLRRTALYKAILTEFFRKGNRENAGTTQNATLGDGIRYSIGSISNSGNTSNNDNSSESFLTKIKNLLTGRPNQQNERIRKKINRMLSNLTGVKIAAGHMNNGLDIVVKDVEKVIRTNRAYDWQNLLPAVGQKIAAILKLNPTESMGNYISDWLLTGALNNTSAESQSFEKALRDNPEIRENLLEIQSAFAQWRNMTPSERIQATIEFERPKPTLKERIKSAKKEGYQQFFEELDPVHDLVKEWEKITGEKLADAVNPYSLLRNYRGIAGRAKLLIEGEESAINALRQMFPSIKWDGFKTIKMILSEIGALENEQTRKEFSAFAEAKHVKDMFTKNYANVAAQKKVQDRIAELQKMKSQTTDDKRIKDLDRRINQNEEKLKNLKESIYDTPYDEATCDAMINKFADKYGQAQKDLVKFSRTTLTILKDSGVISEQAYFNMLRDWKNYVPLHRVFDDNEDIRFGDSLKKMKGSSRDTVDPLQTIIRNTYDYIRRAEKNEAKLMLAKMARTGGVGMLVEEVDGKTPDDKTTIMFYEGGAKKYLQTDVSVVRAVNNMTIPQMDWFTRFLRIGTRVLRNFATVFNPAFAFRNLTRDWQDAFLYSKYGFFSPMDFVRGFVHAVKQDDVYAEWMAAGGAQASFWSVDRDYTEASINNLTKQGLKKYTSLNGFMDLFSRLGEWSELGTRIGYFEKTKKAIAEKNGGKVDRAALVAAALESRDLMDFARGGKASRTWNNRTAFANANLQGWDKFFRTFDPRNGKWQTKEWQRAMINLALTSVVPAVLCFMLNGDDDWYREDLQDYEKQNYWILGENLRIPKGLDLGIRFFSNLTEEFLNSTVNKDPKAFKEWYKPLLDSAPGLIPTGLEPALECLFNYDWFRQRAIVPQYQQKLPAAAQYDANTTSFAKFIGETANISPKKVDHFIFGYTGNMGREGFRIGESILGLRDYNFRGINDLPLLGGFFRMPYQNPKIVRDFYDTLDEQTTWRNEYKATKKKPAEYNEALYNRLHKSQKEMSELGKLERNLMLDPKLSGGVKQERQLAIQKRRVALAERAMR